MIRRMLLIAPLVVLTACMSSTAWSQDPAEKQLDYLLGSWIWEGEINLAGQQQEKFTWRYDCERTLDGRFLLEKQYDMAEGVKMTHIALIGKNGHGDVIRGWGFWTPPR